MAETDAERVGVRTYVPQYQRDEWDRDAEELDMSRAEFVRVMVQAGRRSFDLGGSASETTDTHEDTDDQDATPGVHGLEERLLDILDTDDHLSWEELVAGLTDDIEDRLEEALDELQRHNRVQYNGRRGGYTLVDDE
jgi:hypothetical protein